MGLLMKESIVVVVDSLRSSHFARLYWYYVHNVWELGSTSKTGIHSDDPSTVQQFLK